MSVTASSRDASGRVATAPGHLLRRSVWSAGMLILAFALAASLWGWGVERNAMEAAFGRFAGNLRALERQSALADLETGRVRAAVEALRRDLVAWRTAAEQSPSAEAAVLPNDGPEFREALAEGGQDAPSPEVPPLPEIPAGLNPQVLLRRDLPALLADRALNSSARQLDRVAAARASLALARARERVNVLDAEVRLRIAEASERLRAEGRYIEYGSGERYQEDRDALTVGEETDWGGVRMFYLYPEEFPEIHGMRAEKAAVADRAVRELLAALGPAAEESASGPQVPP